MTEGKRPDTVLTHAGRHPHDFFGVVNTPVFRASTILSRTVAERLAPKGPRDPAYGRRGTPTMFTLEDAVAEIEGAEGAVICPSGMAAVALGYSSMLSAGDHVLVADCVYAPARRYATEALPRHGIGATFFDPGIGAGIAELMRPETKLVYLEAPGSQTFEMQDVPAIAEAAHARGARVAIDNTWATPLYFKPFDHGVDISIHAATKYIVGHSDAMLGVVTCRDAESLELVRAWWNMTGLCAGPDDIYLGTRGIRTMSVRLARHQENAMRVATWLQARPEVERVLYPALPDDPRPRDLETGLHRGVRPVRAAAQSGKRGRRGGDAGRAGAVRHGVELGRLREPDRAERPLGLAHGDGLEPRRPAAPPAYRPRRPRRPDRRPRSRLRKAEGRGVVRGRGRGG